jgi:hypothetical protein
MTYSLREPARNEPCPCGSGKKFKSCCLQRYREERRVGGSGRALFEGRPLDALITGRLDFTRYVIWHRTHTEPFLDGRFPLPEPIAEILDVDIRALGAMLDDLREAYDANGIRDTFPAVLDRVRDAIKDLRWTHRILYQKALWAAGRRWDEEAARQILKDLDIATVTDFDLVAFYLDIFGDTLGLTSTLAIVDHAVALAEWPGERLQYVVLKGMLLILLGDENAGRQLVTTAVAEYDGKGPEDLDIREKHLLGEALIILGSPTRDSTQLARARGLLRAGLRSEKLTDEGRSLFHKAVGDAFVGEDDYRAAGEEYLRSQDYKPSPIAMICLARCYARTSDTGRAVSTLQSIEYDALSVGEQYDHTICFAEVLLAGGDARHRDQVVDRLSQLDPPQPKHREIRDHFRLALTVAPAADRPGILQRLRSLIDTSRTSTSALFNFNFSVVREVHVGDNYNIGQAGAVGPGAHAHDMSFEQTWNGVAASIDLTSLSAELERLRHASKGEAKTADHDASVGHIALAEGAAKRKDGPGTLAHLAKAGKWSLGIAEKIGVPIAAAAIKAGLGL